MKLGSEKVSVKSRPQGFRTNPRRAPACHGLGEQPGEREGLERKMEFWKEGGGVLERSRVSRASQRACGWSHCCCEREGSSRLRPSTCPFFYTRSVCNLM